MNRKMLARALPHVFGILSLAAICVGIWGKWGWEWALMAAGLPPASFYLFGEIRDARAPSRAATEPEEEG